MGFLDHLLDGVGVGGTGKLLRHNLRAAEKLLAEGERGRAHIAGIRVRVGTDGSPDDHEFSLLLDSTSERVGCRQRLGALTPSIRLGMEVPVRLGGGRGRAIIDTRAMGGDEDAKWGYKPLGEPPADGIVDGNLDLGKERRRAVDALITVVSVEPVEILGLRTQNSDLRVRVAAAGRDPYETLVKREVIPFYALHLADPGTELPGLVRSDRPDKVRIDWPAAALADPGIGRPPVSAVAAPPPAAVAARATETDGRAWTPEALAADELGEISGVGFPTWVEVEAGLVRDRIEPADHDVYAQRYGVPSGAWAVIQAAWKQRMMSDPRVGARFGSEYQAALKRR